MQRLEDRHEARLTRKRRIGGIPLVKDDAVFDLTSRQVFTRLRDRHGVEIDAIDLYQRVCLGDRDARPAAPAGDVRYPGGRSLRSLSCTAETAGSHWLPSWVSNIGRVNAACPSARSTP